MKKIKKTITSKVTSDIETKTYNFRAPVAWAEKISKLDKTLSEIAREAVRAAIVDSVTGTNQRNFAARDEIIISLLEEAEKYRVKNEELRGKVHELELTILKMNGDELAAELLED
ncbi:hypothetical protein C9J01_27670 [Photobacterium rosenbergii]|uniref:Uncharacterized protein n=1 Tax=Photobacterium rosenbergii TaxID=294936 RepID=A0A2T3MYQ0_9GAMM|nr:hypothetical protein [Photobacterium rosenbergii]PSW05047.1 hypothetical protein C9J01_27670 [Photobacterium rosenbergii]